MILGALQSFGLSRLPWASVISSFSTISFIIALPSLETLSVRSQSFQTLIDVFTFILNSYLFSLLFSIIFSTDGTKERFNVLGWWILIGVFGKLGLNIASAGFPCGSSSKQQAS